MIYVVSHSCTIYTLCPSPCLKTSEKKKEGRDSGEVRRQNTLLSDQMLLKGVCSEVLLATWTVGTATKRGKPDTAPIKKIKIKRINQMIVGVMSSSHHILTVSSA